jgi:hypothetical protein
MASLADHTPVIAAWQSLKRWRQKHQWRKIAITLVDPSTGVLSDNADFINCPGRDKHLRTHRWHFFMVWQ